MYSEMATPGLIQGGRGNLPNYSLLAYFQKKPPKSPPEFKMAKCTLKWQHLNSGREGKSSKYSLLAYFEKKSTQKAPKRFEMAKCTLKWQHLNSGREGKSSKYSLLAYFEKKSTQKAPKRFEMAKCTLKWQHLNSGREGKSIKYSLLAYFEKKPVKSPYFFSKRLRNSILATPGLIREGKGEVYQISTYGVFWKKKKHPKSPEKIWNG